jgi:hypothetical protein
MFGARFVGNHASDLPHQGFVEGGRQSDGLGKDRGDPCASHAVQRLVPPPIGGHAEALDGGRAVHHLGDFFLARHARHEIAGSGQKRLAQVEIERGSGSGAAGSRAVPSVVGGQRRRWRRSTPGRAAERSRRGRSEMRSERQIVEP